MALANTTVKSTYQGDAVTVAFAIPFTILVNDSSEVKVYVRDESVSTLVTETLQVEGGGQDYTLTGASPPGTPFNTTVTFNVAPASTSKIVIIRSFPLTQTLDLEEGGDFPAESFETALDRIAGQVQEVKEFITRMPYLRASEQFGSTELDHVDANDLIIVNDDNDGFEFRSPSEVLAIAEGGVTAMISAAISNGQTSADVTGLILDSTVYSSAVVWGEITRGTDGGHITLSVRYINGAWVVKEVWANTNLAHGLTWNITAAGQVQYSSGGEGTGSFKHRMLRYGV
jgi:hypothetical protein